MLRKTISIAEYLKNFSDLVSSFLQKAIKKKNYKKQIEAMALDPMVLDDLKKIQEDFKYVEHK